MILSLIDKCLFGLILLVALQVPLLADHYRQFISGYYEATKYQVQGYEATAKKHHYVDVISMINDHAANASPSIRTDAEQKRETLALYTELESALATFEEGNLLQKTAYMFNPGRYDRLTKTLDNFSPGLPLSLESLAFGFISALLLNGLIVFPSRMVYRRVTRRQLAQSHGQAKPVASNSRPGKKPV